MTSDSPILVVATSAPMGRPAYRRDLLNCLCYPEEIDVRFTYRRRWMDPRLLDPASPLPDDFPVVIVFCDQKDPAVPRFDFLPVRRARLVGFEPASFLALPDPDIYVAVRFRLESFVRLDPVDTTSQLDAWQQWIAAYPEHPRPKDPTYTGPSRFVFMRAGFQEGGKLADEQAWELLSERVSSAKSLDGCTLFRVSEFCEHKAAGAGGVSFVDFAGSKALEVRSNRSYRLRLQFHIDVKKASRPPQALAPSTSIASLNISAPLLESIGESTSASIIINCARVYEDEIGTLVIENPKDTKTLAPRAEFPVLLRRQRWLLTTVLLLLFFGAMASGISADTIKEVASDDSWLESHASAVENAVTVVGAALVALAGYLGFKKLPGG